MKPTAEGNLVELVDGEAAIDMNDHEFQHLIDGGFVQRSEDGSEITFDSKQTICLLSEGTSYKGQIVGAMEMDWGEFMVRLKLA